MPHNAELGEGMAAIQSMLWLAFYIVIFTPAAVIYRLIRRDPLRLQKQANAASYWRVRADQQYRRMTSRY